MQNGKIKHVKCFQKFTHGTTFFALFNAKSQKPKGPEKLLFFVDKCMPFGASISCAHFKKFLDTVAHIVQYKTHKKPINYLDNFFFAALL